MANGRVQRWEQKDPYAANERMLRVHTAMADRREHEDSKAHDTAMTEGLAYYQKQKALQDQAYQNARKEFQDMPWYHQMAWEPSIGGWLTDYDSGTAEENFLKERFPDGKYGYIKSGSSDLTAPFKAKTGQKDRFGKPIFREGWDLKRETEARQLIEGLYGKESIDGTIGYLLEDNSNPSSLLDLIQ